MLEKQENPAERQIKSGVLSAGQDSRTVPRGDLLADELDHCWPGHVDVNDPLAGAADSFQPPIAEEIFMRLNGEPAGPNGSPGSHR